MLWKIQVTHLELGSVVCLRLVGQLLPLGYSKRKHAIVIFVAVQGNARLLELFHLMLDKHVKSCWPPLRLGLVLCCCCRNISSGLEDTIGHAACGLENVDGVAQVTEELLKLTGAKAHQLCGLSFAHTALLSDVDLRIRRKGKFESTEIGRSGSTFGFETQR